MRVTRKNSMKMSWPLKISLIRVTATNISSKKRPFIEQFTQSIRRIDDVSRTLLLVDLNNGEGVTAQPVAEFRQDPTVIIWTSVTRQLKSYRTVVLY